jgi:RNA polymerase sigma-70 factor (ECF subfamily)
MASELKDAIGAEAAIQHIDSLYRYALSLTRNRDDAEDLVQDTYVRALPALHRLRSDSNLKSWLFTIMRNNWINQLRKRNTTRQLIQIGPETNRDDELAPHYLDSLEILVSEEGNIRVRSAIEKLSDEFREIIQLREFEDLSYAEIAHVLDCPVGTVMSRLARARARLRNLLADPAIYKKPSSEGIIVRIDASTVVTIALNCK